MINEPFYVEDIDTPDFEFLRRQLTTKDYVLKPLTHEHFLDLFEFRLQNEPIDCDPFDNLGEKFENAYTQFFTYTCNIDNIAWVLIDRIYIVGLFLLEMEVDYNDYMSRNAHLYYEMSNSIKDVDSHIQCIKAITNLLFNESDIPLIELHIDDNEEDRECRLALEKLGFSRDDEKNPDIGFRFYLQNLDPIIESPPRHMPFILKAYRDSKTKNT